MTCALAALTVATAMAVPSEVRAAGPTFSISAPSSVAVGHPIVIELHLADAPEVTGYESYVRFDKDAAEFGGLFAGGEDAPAANVDTVVATDPVDATAFAVYTCKAAGCPGDAANVAEGRRQLENVRLRIVPQRAGTLTIDLSQLRFVTATGQRVKVAVPETTLTVAVTGASSGPARFDPAPSGFSLSSRRVANPDPRRGRLSSRLDATSDGRVTFVDVSSTSLAWEKVRTSGRDCQSASALADDVNGDGCVDVSDIQIIAATANAPSAGNGPSAYPASVTPYIVNTTNDLPDANIGNGTCLTANNDCSLRAALNESNGTPGPNRVEFAIPGAGVHTIQLGQQLPTINDDTGGVTVDGYTQPGAVVNTDPLVSNAQIMIEVRGGGPSAYDAFLIVSGYNVIRGLSIYESFNNIKLYGAGAHHNQLLGNFIGTNVAATYISPGSWSLGHGIYVESGPHHNLFGTAALADRNIISGNSQLGIRMDHENTDGNVIRNNIFGLKPSGTDKLPNGRMGIDIQWGPSDNIVGGLGEHQGNVFSGHSYTGIDLSHSTSTSNNYVVGNFIGTTPAGNAVADYTRTGFGIIFKDDVANNFVYGNVVGGANDHALWHKQSYTGRNYIFANRVGIARDGTPLPNSRYGMYLQGHDWKVGPANIFANNAAGGILVVDNASTRNEITANTFINNGGLAIDLAPEGPTANDPGDGDSGPDSLLNYPELTAASPTAVNGTACVGCRIEVYKSSLDTGNRGEGNVLVGTGTAPSGTFSVAVTGLNAGDLVAAVAIDPSGNTSEFSVVSQVQGAAAPPPGPAPGPTATVTGKFETVTTTAGPTWAVVALAQAYVKPVVTCSTTSSVNTGPVAVRMKDVTTTSFTIMLAPASAPATVAPESVHCLAAEEGVWKLPDGTALEAASYTSTVTDGTTAGWVGDTRTYGQSYLAPVVFGQVMTANDASVSMFWSRGSTLASPAGPSKLITGKHVGEDTVTTRAAETVGYIVIDGGHRTLAGTEYEAAVGPRTAKGVVNGDVNYSFTQPFPAAPSGAVVSQGGISDLQGSWAVLHGTTPLAADHVSVSVDEDNFADTERSHGLERVGYFAFAGPIVAQWDPNPPPPPPPTPSVTYIVDDFTRSFFETWGFTEIGGAYSMGPGLTANQSFNVNGNEGTIDVAAGAFRDAAVKSINATDLNVSLRVKTSQVPTAYQDVFVNTRVQKFGDQYRVGLRILPSHKVQLKIIAIVSGVYTTIGSVTLPSVTHTAGSYLRVRVQAEGTGTTTVRARVWADGTPEPATWGLTATDSSPALQIPGWLMLRSQLPSNETAIPTTFTFDDLLVTSIT